MIPSDSAFKTAIFNALCACLEVPSSSADASALIRPFPADPESPPAPFRDHPVLYYDVRPEDSPDAGYMTFTGENPTAAGAYPAVSAFLPYKLIIICYGFNCLGMANHVRRFLYLDGAGYARSILRKAGIYPVPNPPMPVQTYEEEGNLLRRRTDLEIELRVKDTLVRQNMRPGIAGPPAVVIRK